MARIPIKSLTDGTTSLHSLIYIGNKEGECSDACKFVARHCANMSYHIKGIDFDQSYSPMAHADSFRININIMDIHKLTARILDVSDAFQNKTFLVHERVCVSPPPYYLDWFETSYPNVPLN